jgi:hypothetical protein
MKKVITVAVVAVLLVGSSAIAQINLQGQNWGLGLNTDITLSGGTADGSTIQGIGTLSMQNIGINPDQNGDPTVSASQGIGAALFQDGAVHTGGALTTLNQDLLVQGWTLGNNGPGQVQSVGDLAGPAMEFQGVKVDGLNDIDKGRGSEANADGLNLVAFGMGQEVKNNCADGSQLSLILGGQYSVLDGTAQAVGGVTSTMTALVVQVQVANTPPTAP